MSLYARWLFGAAALLNFSVAGGLVFLLPWVSSILDLDPITGTNLAFLYLTAGFIGVFGLAYVLLAFDPVGNRPLILLAVIGKLVAVGGLACAWLVGGASVRMVALSGADLIFALLFVDFMRRTRPAGAR